MEGIQAGFRPYIKAIFPDDHSPYHVIPKVWEFRVGFRFDVEQEKPVVAAQKQIPFHKCERVDLNSAKTGGIGPQAIAVITVEALAGPEPDPSCAVLGYAPDGKEFRPSAKVVKGDAVGQCSEAEKGVKKGQTGKKTFHFTYDLSQGTNYYRIVAGHIRFVQGFV